MAEINRNDLISDDAIRAPGILAQEFEKLLLSVKKLLGVTTEMGQNIGQSKTIGDLSKQVDGLNKTSQELNKTQTAISESSKQRTREEAAALDLLVAKRRQMISFNKLLKDSDESAMASLKAKRITLEQYNKILNENSVFLKRNEFGLREVNKEIKQTVPLVAKNVAAYTRLQAELQKATITYKNMAAAGNATTVQMQQQLGVIASLKGQLNSINSTISQTGSSSNTSSSMLTKFLQGFGLVSGILVAVQAIKSFFSTIKEGVTAFIEFEKSNSELKAVLGGTGVEMADLKRQQLELGQSTLYTTNQVIGLQTELAKLGFPTEDIKKMTPSILDAAQALGSDLARQAALTGATLKSFNLTADDTVHVNDLLAKSAAISALDFAKLETSIPIVGSVGNLFGLKVEDVVALLASLSNAGFQASMAATATRNILLNLADANGKLAKSLKEPVKDFPSLLRGLRQLKDEGIDLGEALEVTDKRSVNAFSHMLQNSNSLEVIRERLDNVEGAALMMAATMRDNLDSAVQRLGSSWKTMITSWIESDSFIIKAARNITAFATSVLNFLTVQKPLTDALVLERVELQALVESITDANTSTEARAALILQMETQYPNFLKNLTEEERTNANLALRMAEVNDQFDRKILATVANEKNESISKGIAEAAIEEAAALRRLNEVRKNLETGNVKSRVVGNVLVSGEQSAKAEIRVLEKQIFEVREKIRDLKALRELNKKDFEAANKLIIGDFFDTEQVTPETPVVPVAKGVPVDENIQKRAEKSAAESRESRRKAEADLEETILELKVAAAKKALEITKKYAGHTTEAIQNAMKDQQAAELALEDVRRKNLVAAEDAKFNELQIKHSKDNKQLADDEARHLSNIENINKRTYEELKTAKDDQVEGILLAETKAYEAENKSIAEIRKARGIAAQIQTNELIAHNKNIETINLKSAEKVRVINDNLDKDILEDKREALQEQHDLTLRFLKEDEEEAISAVANLVKKKVVTIEEGEKMLKDVKGNYRAQELQMEIDYVSKILSLSTISFDERAALEKKLFELKIQYNAQILANTADTEQTIWEEADEWLKEYAELFRNIQQALVSIGTATTARQIQNIERERKAYEESTKEKLKLAGSNEKAKMVIETRAAQHSEQLEHRKIELQRRAAAFNKAAALVDAGFNIAVAITKMMAATGPLGFVLGAAAAAAGAAQIAAIAATPLPRYEVGTDNAKGGAAIVGEKGAELVTTPQGQSFLTPGKPTIMNIPKGSVIETHEKTMSMLASSTLREQRSVDQENYVLHLYNKVDQLNKTIKEYNGKIVKAVKEGAVDYYEVGSTLYKNKKSVEGHIQRIRQKTMGL